MKSYESVGYRVRWQGGEGVYYPDVDYLDVAEGAIMPSAEEMEKLCAAGARHHRGVIKRDFALAVGVMVFVLVGTVLATWLND